MSQTLKNKRALVTGGSRGIGAAIVKRLASEGADVAFTYASSPDRAHETAEAARASGGKVIAIQSDSADADAVISAVEQTVSELGGIDINVRAVFVATQAAVKHMKEGGRIIKIGSCNAERMPFQGGAVYAMSKSALQGLVQGLARDLGARGITVNNVQPGPINTDMNPESGEFAEVLKKQFMAVPRYGTADEVAAMVAYLSGPEAGYVTGASLTIDGGFNA